MKHGTHFTTMWQCVNFSTFLATVERRGAALLKWVTRRGDNWTLATLAISSHSAMFCAVIKWHGCATNKRDNGRGLSQSVRWNNSSHPPSPVMCRAAPCIPWINYHRPLKTSPAKLFSQQILLELNWEIPIVGRTKKYISVNSQVSLRQKCGKSCFWIEQIHPGFIFAQMTGCKVGWPSIIFRSRIPRSQRSVN